MNQRSNRASSMKSPKFSTRRAARRAPTIVRGSHARTVIKARMSRAFPSRMRSGEAVAHQAAPARAFHAQLAARSATAISSAIAGTRSASRKADLVRGRVQGHPDGFGFLVRDDRGPDLFLGPREMHQVLHGDRVVARIAGTDRRGRPEGKIVEVLEHAHQRLVGRLRQEHGIVFVVAEDRRISHEFLVQPHETGGARPGQVVTVEILAQPSKQAKPVARVVEVLGDYADPGMEIEIALRKHALPYVFSPEAERLCQRLPDAVPTKTATTVPIHAAAARDHRRRDREGFR